MKKKAASNPLEANRQQLIDLLMHKSALKQDIADDLEVVFDDLRKLIETEREAQTIFYSLTKEYEKMLKPFFKILDENKILETL